MVEAPNCFSYRALMKSEIDAKLAREGGGGGGAGLCFPTEEDRYMERHLGPQASKATLELLMVAEIRKNRETDAVSKTVRF